MMGSRPSVSGVVGFLLLCASAFVVSGTALAQVSISKYIVVQPVVVCATDGTNCATFGASCPLPNAQGNQACTFFNSPSAATTTTPIGFLDSNTNRNLTRQTWWQAGIDVTYLPIKQYNNSNYQDLTVTCTTKGCDSTGSPSFQMLSQGSPSFPANATGCTSNCADPAASTNTANAIYMFFINSLTPGTSSTPSPLYGFGWLNGDGVAVASNSFSQLRFDTMAHELGHNCNLDHTIEGAGQNQLFQADGVTPMPGSGPNNLMTSGAYRVTPASTPDAVSDVTPPTLPPWKNADYITLITDQNAKTLKTSEQTACLSSGFINPSYNASATAGGGLMTAATTNTAPASSSSSSGALIFVVDFPALPSGAFNGRQNAYMRNVVVTPPSTLNVVSNSFFVCDINNPCGNPPQFGINFGSIPAADVTGAILHGNNGIGNVHCVKPVVGGPSVECEVATIAPDVFTANTNNVLVFSLTIDDGSTPITLAQLAGTEFTWIFETDQTDSSGNTTVAELFAISSVFNGSSTVNSGSPDPANFSQVLNPDTFTGFNSFSCVLGTNGKCPKPTGGNWAKVSGTTPFTQSEP